jgi:hypothetical protein
MISLASLRSDRWTAWPEHVVDFIGIRRGLAAASLAFLGTMLVLFDYNVPLYLFLPVLPFELAIGVWLIVKGFNESAFASESPETAMNGTE